MNQRRVRITCDNCGEVSTFINTEPELVKCLECCVDVEFLQHYLGLEVKPGRGDEPLDVDRIREYALALVIAEKHRRYLEERLVE